MGQTSGSDLPNSHLSRRVRAAVIGVGQVGSRFDEEPGRITVSSHVGAYMHLSDRFELVGAVDILPANIAAFRKRCPSVPIFASTEELMAAARPDIVSICTPAESHAAVLQSILKAETSPRMVWCEKPLSDDMAAAASMIAACARKNIPMMVSFNRRWLPLWRRARDLIEANTVGKIRSIRIAMPNRLFSIGSHAVNLLLMLGGSIETVAPLHVPSLDEQGEPAITAAFVFRDGAAGLIQLTGLKSQLIIEAEILGDDGRIVVCEGRQTLTVETFGPSAEFSGYKVLGEPRAELIDQTGNFSAFVAMAENALAALEAGAPLISDGSAALETQHILRQMADSVATRSS